MCFIKNFTRATSKLNSGTCHELHDRSDYWYFYSNYDACASWKLPAKNWNIIQKFSLPGETSSTRANYVQYKTQLMPCNRSSEVFNCRDYAPRWAGLFRCLIPRGQNVLHQKFHSSVIQTQHWYLPWASFIIGQIINIFIRIMMPALQGNFQRRIETLYKNSLCDRNDQHSRKLCPV